MVVPANPIVEHLDEIENSSLGQVTRFTESFLDALLHQTAEEGLSYSITQ